MPAAPTPIHWPTTGSRLPVTTADVGSVAMSGSRWQFCPKPPTTSTPATIVKRVYVPPATYTACRPSAAAFASAWSICRHGVARDPHAAAPAPVGDTSTARAMSPSWPSQLESTNAGSSGSGLPGAIVGSAGAQSLALGTPSPSASGPAGGAGPGAAERAGAAAGAGAGAAAAGGCATTPVKLL